MNLSTNRLRLLSIIMFNVGFVKTKIIRENWDLTSIIVYLMLWEIFNIGLCLLMLNILFLSFPCLPLSPSLPRTVMARHRRHHRPDWSPPSRVIMDGVSTVRACHQCIVIIVAGKHVNRQG